MEYHPLKRFRDAKEPPMTQAALASMLGVTKATISRWESGLREPRSTVRVKITELTGITPAELLRESAG